MLWNKRFDKNLSHDAFSFSTSINIDIELFEKDIQQNRAHSKMLNSIGLITDDELNAIFSGLDKLVEKFKNNDIKDLYKYEDIHSAIELELKNIIGDLADKIHTGRSRNDQVATIFRMWIKEKSSELIKYCRELQINLIETAKKHIDTIIPGYTHLQRAQPVSLAHHLLAYVEMLERDINRLQSTFEETDYSPLGSGALAGSSLPLDREMTKDLLGFKGICSNSMDAVSDRDFALDFLNCCSIGMMHLSRFSEEIILWCSSEWNFMILSDEYSTGSSLMPQKKNPDITELIRGKTGRVCGNQLSLLSTLKGLPLTYNRDLQEDKDPVIDSFNQYSNALKLLSDIIKTASFNKNRFTEELNGDYAFATDIVDWLVLKGVAFRQAHSIVGKIVKYAVSNQKKLNELTLNEYKQFFSGFDESVFKLSLVDKCLERKKTYGSPNPKFVLEEIKKYERKFSQ